MYTETAFWHHVLLLLATSTRTDFPDTVTGSQPPLQREARTSAMVGPADQSSSCLKLLGGCGFKPSKKYDFVSWDDYSQLNGTIKNVPNHQSANR